MNSAHKELLSSTQREKDSSVTQTEADAILTSQEIIDTFLTQEGAVGHQHTYGDFSVFSVQPADMPPLSDQQLRDYVDEYPEIKRQGWVNQCLRVAQYSYAQNRYQAQLLGTPDGAGELIGYGNHYLVQYSLPDQSLMAVDLTAGVSMDEADTFQVLVVRAHNQNQIIQLLNQLYGGDWQVY